ncbi:MAG: ketosteroid isomerase-like protein [Candidatus Paceibacteria bacterium]|jgi:ketosteroid isomerase-like protein
MKPIRFHSHSLALLVVLGIQCPGTVGSGPQAHDRPALETRTTSDVAEAYLALCFGVERDDDWAVEMGQLFATDALFIDPTTAFFGMSLADGIEGRENITSAMHSFNLNGHALDIQASFTSGDHYVVFGEFSYMTQRAAQPDGPLIKVAFPFTTILRVEAGLIHERRDYGDYWELSRSIARHEAGPDGVGSGLEPLDALEKHLRDLADPYLAAYFERDEETLAGWWARDFCWTEPTASLFQSSAPVCGAEAVLELFGAAEAADERISTPVGSFTTDKFAVFLQRADLASTESAATESKPTQSLIVIEFEGDKVLRHLEFNGDAL